MWGRPKELWAWGCGCENGLIDLQSDEVYGVKMPLMVQPFPVGMRVDASTQVDFP